MCSQATPYHLGVRVEAQETNPDPVGRDQGIWGIDRIEGIEEQPGGAGNEIHSPITHVRGRTSMVRLADPGGNPIGLLEGTA